jgi:hypothetical protein
MSEFVNMEKVDAVTSMVAAYYPFPRAVALKEAVSVCITDYFIGQNSGKTFEASGVFVTGNSRVGKSREIEQLLSKINASNTVMPTGLAAHFISVKVPGSISFRELGEMVSVKLGYPADGRRTSKYIWDRNRDQARRQGVIGIHVDEAQHMFTDTGKSANRATLDSLKGLLKDSDWPFILILSGVPALRTHLETDTAAEERKQLRFLLSHVHFDMINPRDGEHIQEVGMLAQTFAGGAQVSFDSLFSADFLQRISHAGLYRWGYVIQLMIDAFTICKLAGRKKVTRRDFSLACSKKYGLPDGFTPFDVDDYLNTFDPEILFRSVEDIH